MKAVQIVEPGPVEVLHPIQAPNPAPGAGEVRIRNRVAGVNFVDTLVRAGALPPGAIQYPIIPGVEGAGEIEELGPGVSQFAVGDRVMWFAGLGSGGYGSSVVAPVHGVVRIADHVSFTVAGASPVAAVTAHHMLVNLAKVQSGDWVLVHKAAGGVGSIILQLARAAGLRTVALAKASKHSFVKEIGADAIVDDRAEDLADQITTITGPAGVALSLNSTGGDSLITDLRLLGPFGVVVGYGFLSGPPGEGLAAALLERFSASPSIRMSDIYTHFTHDPVGFNRDLSIVAAHLADGVFKPSIDRVFPLNQAGEAHLMLEQGRAQGKLVLEIDD
ncbi:MAG: zinc-binding dehydrogenase [Alphaproteobacteria bacterium]|nr:zinc-binding dehydrogenase [Alphaproteobacteria bacterium]